MNGYFCSQKVPKHYFFLGVPTTWTFHLHQQALARIVSFISKTRVYLCVLSAPQHMFLEYLLYQSYCFKCSGWPWSLSAIKILQPRMEVTNI
jgi:hypothetical protein